MTTTAKARPTRLEAAQAELERARNAADALRSRQLETGDVPASEFAAAGTAVELAELALTGAEENEVRLTRERRLRQLDKLRAEILQTADPGPVIAAAEQIVSAVTVLVAALGPQRSRRISGQLAELRALGVAETERNAQPLPADGHLGWHSAGMLNAQPRIRVGERLIAPVDLGPFLAALISRGCRQAGEHPGIAGASGAPHAVADDPRAFIERNM